MNNKRGQVSTEYLVIIGVVLVIALIVVFLLTRTTGLSGGTVETQSKNYWASAAPFSVSTYKASGTALDLSMKNTDVEQLTLTGVSGTGITTNSNLSTVFASSQERTVTVTLSSDCGTVGTRFQFANITFTYDKGAVTGLRQVGSIPLAGSCS